MSPRKIYFISALGGLVLALAVVLVVNFVSTPKSDQAASVDFPNWVKVTPATRLFTASFPTSPIRTEAVLPLTGTTSSILQEFHAATDSRGNVFQVATFVYPQALNIEQATEALDAAVQGMVTAAPGNTLVEKTTAKINDLPARFFTIQDKNGYYYQGELFVKDRLLYQAFVTYSGGDLPEKDLTHFLETVTPTI